MGEDEEEGEGVKEEESGGVSRSLRMRSCVQSSGEYSEWVGGVCVHAMVQLCCAVAVCGVRGDLVDLYDALAYLEAEDELVREQRRQRHYTRGGRGARHKTEGRREMSGQLP